MRKTYLIMPLGVIVSFGLGFGLGAILNALSFLGPALEAAIRSVEHDVAIETAVGKMEQDLLATDMRQIARDEDVSHAAPSFISRLRQFFRDRMRSRESLSGRRNSHKICEGARSLCFRNVQVHTTLKHF